MRGEPEMHACEGVVEAHGRSAAAGGLAGTLKTAKAASWMVIGNDTPFLD
jgi:hypothetical protein